MHLARRALLCFLIVLPLAACTAFRPVKDQLDKIEDKAACAGRAQTLVVLLPGIFDAPKDFVREQFIDAIRERKLSVDVVAPDAHLGYYQMRNIVERLHEDIILPARRVGYRQIWLAGVSLGGYGSLLYAQYHAEAIDGIFLIAPYLGSDQLLKEIAKAGGPADWKVGGIDEHEPDRELWGWLQKRVAPRPPTMAIAAPAASSASGSSGPSGTSRTSVIGSPPIYIGYGAQDRFAPGNRMFAAMLPPGHSAITEGGHEWKPWHRLWEGFLDRRLLPSCD